MDFSVFVIIWLVVVVLQNVLEKQKKPTSNPPPQNSETFPDFEIPTLANDPNFSNYQVKEVNLHDFYNRKKSAVQSETKISQPVTQVEQKKFSLDLTPSATMNAIILGEILSKPKFKK